MMPDDMTDQDQPPQTLPGDFFDKLDQQQQQQSQQQQTQQGGPPATLPGDFFDKQDQQDREKKTPPPPDDGMNAFREQHPYLSIVPDIVGGIGSGAFSTLRGINQVANKGASYLPGSPQIPMVIPESWAKAPTSGWGALGHYGEQMGEFFLPGTKIAQANKAIEAAKLPFLARVAARGATEAIPAAGITYAQTGGDKTAAELSGGIAGGFGMALPAAATWAKHYLGKRTGVGVEAIEKAAEGAPEFKAGLTGQIDESDILKTARDALETVKEERRLAYQSALQKLPQTQALDLTPVRSQFLSSLRDHRIGAALDPTGQLILDFSRSPVKTDGAAMQAIQDTAHDLWLWGQRPSDLRTNGVDTLKRIIDARFSPKMQGRAIIDATKNRVRDVLNSVPGYEQMTKGYADASNLLDNLADLSLHSKNDGTAIRKLTTILNQNNGYRSGLLEALSKRAGVDIGALIAGNRMNTWAPRGIAGPLQVATSMFSAHGLATILGAITLSSPRAAANVVRGAATFGPQVPRVAGSLPSLLHITGQQPDYDKQQPQFAEGGKVRYDDGGDVDSDDPDGVLADIKKRGMIQLGAHPGQFHQQPITIDPEKSKQRVFGDYRDPNAPPPPAAPPKPSLPWEQQAQQPQGDPNDVLDKYILSPVVAGMGQVARGLEQFSQPKGTPQEAAGAGHDIVSGTFGLATPFMLQSGLASPSALARTAVTLGGAGAVQEIVGKEMQASGYAPEYIKAASDVAGLVAGSAIHGKLPGGAPAASSMELGPRSEQVSTGGEQPVVLQDFVANRGGFASPAHMVLRSMRPVTADEIHQQFFPDFGPDQLTVQKLRADDFMSAVQQGRQPFRLQFRDQYGRAIEAPPGIEERIGLRPGENYNGPGAPAGGQAPAPGRFSQEGLDATVAAARQRLIERGTLTRQLNMAMGPEDIKDLAILTGAQLGSKVSGLVAPTKAPAALKGLTSKAVLREIKKKIPQRESYGVYAQENPTAGAELLPGLEEAQPAMTGRPMLPRNIPRKVSPRVADALQNPEVERQLHQWVQEGGEKMPEDWYRTSPLFQRYIQEYGNPEAAAKPYEQFWQSFASASPRNPVPTNARAGTYYNYLISQGLKIPNKPVKGYGNIAQRLHVQNARRIQDFGSLDPLKNPKPASFVENLLGNEMPITSDTHNFRALGMAAKDPRFLATNVESSEGNKTAKALQKFNPKAAYERGELSMEDALSHPSYWVSAPSAATEYGPYEAWQQKQAASIGLAPSNWQGKMWVGAGPTTGLSSPGEIVLRTLARRVAYTADRMGVPREVVLKKMIRGEIPLLGVGAGAVGLGALSQQNQDNTPQAGLGSMQ